MFCRARGRAMPAAIAPEPAGQYSLRFEYTRRLNRRTRALRPGVTAPLVRQKVARMPIVAAIGAAGLKLRGLVAPGAWMIGMAEVGENVPKV